MTTPQVGVTHDLVLYVSDTVTCGLVVKPYTLRVAHAPLFIPRITNSDPRGMDRARWMSYIQARFDGGAGQSRWSRPSGNMMFAHSRLIDIKAPLLTFTPDVNDAASSDIRLLPRAIQTTGVVSSAETYFNASISPAIQMIEMSGRPHMFVQGGAFVYTNLGSGGDPPLVVKANQLTGKWATVFSYANNPAWVHRVVSYSSVAVIAIESTGILNYGSTHTAGQTPAVLYRPAYATVPTEDVAVFDNKLWRSVGNWVQYLQPTTTSTDAAWSDQLYVGDAASTISRMKEFNGRLYMGKEDGLWVFDAGIIYRVEDYSHARSLSNFACFEVCRGSLYYNIHPNQMYRLTSAGTVELLQIPLPTGAIVSGGAVIDNELFINMRGYQSNEVFIFNADTGASYKWDDSNTAEGGFKFVVPVNAWNRFGIATWRGHIFAAPVYATGFQFTPNRFPAVAAGMLHRGWRYFDFPDSPHHPVQNAYMMTSIMDFGYPDLEKLLNRLIVEFDASPAVDVKIWAGFDPRPSTDWNNFNYGNGETQNNPPIGLPLGNTVLLGTINVASAALPGKGVLQFPSGKYCKSLILLFDVTITDPDQDYSYLEIKSFEVEYMFAPSRLRTFDAVAIVSDNIELINGAKENSAAFIAATLYSVSASPSSFVVGVPWPTAHTLRGIITVTQPGGFVPGLAFDAQHIDGAEVPIRIDEV